MHGAILDTAIDAGHLTGHPEGARLLQGALAEVSFELAKADASAFVDDVGKLRSPAAMASPWDRRLK